MDEEQKNRIAECIKDLKSADEQNPVSNAFFMEFQNRMAGCLTELVTQIKKINDTLYSIDKRLESIDQNTEGR